MIPVSRGIRSWLGLFLREWEMSPRARDWRQIDFFCKLLIEYYLKIFYCPMKMRADPARISMGWAGCRDCFLLKPLFLQL